MHTHRIMKSAGIAVLALATAFACLSFAWAEPASDTASEAVAASEDNEKVLTIADFKDGTAAVMAGSVQEDLIRQFLPDKKILLFKSNTDTAVAISTAKADFTAVPELVAKKFVAQYPNLIRVPCYECDNSTAYAMAKGSTSTRVYQEINEFLDAVTADGRMQSLQEIWFGEDESQKVMDDPESLPNINGNIRVVTRSDNEPFEYMRDGKFVGYEMALLVEFAKEYGYSLEFTATEFDSLIMSVATGKADLIVGNLSMTEERAKSVDYTKPINKVLYNIVYNDTYFEGGSTSLSESNNSLVNSFIKTFITENRWQLILNGLGVTLLITIGAAILGTALGFCLALVRRYRGRKANAVLDVYIRIFQGTPVLVMLLIFYYVVFGKIDIPSALVAIFVFGLNSAAFICVNLHSCLEAVDPGQREAALASGYTERQAFMFFVLPIAIRHMLPVYRGEIISLLKGTSIVGYVAIIDLTKAGDLIRSRTYEAIFPLLTVAIIYLLMAWIISIILRKVEKKLLGTRPKTTIKGVTLQ